MLLEEVVGYFEELSFLVFIPVIYVTSSVGLYMREGQRSKSFHLLVSYGAMINEMIDFRF